MSLSHYVSNRNCHRLQYPGLIMEEEIPTGLYQLRMISKNALHRKFPGIKFKKFVLSTLVRLVIGYVYIFNMFLVIAQASGVLGECHFIVSCWESCMTPRWKLNQHHV